MSHCGDVILEDSLIKCCKVLVILWAQGTNYTLSTIHAIAFLSVFSPPSTLRPPHLLPPSFGTPSFFFPPPLTGPCQGEIMNCCAWPGLSMCVCVCVCTCVFV